MVFSAALGLSTPAAAEVAPLNGDLTFARNGEILRIGTQALVRDVRPGRILSGMAASDPAWSPDSLNVAFAGRRGRNLDIWAISSDGNLGPRRLTAQSAIDTEPDWSPGGGKIAFTSRRDGNSEIYVMTSTGLGQVRLAPSPGTDRQPVWSPDGTKIAFVSDRGGSFEIWVMNANGTDAEELTQEGAATDPAWSRDGRIAYASGTGDATSIVSVDGRGAGRRQVTSGAKGDRFPAWSPDGLQVAFSRGKKVMVARAPRLGGALATIALSGEQHRKLLASGTNPDWGVVPPASTAPRPEVGETANVIPAKKGDVTVRVPGALEPAPLENARQLPVNTSVDTTRGQVILVAPAGDGDTTRAVASDGRFTYRQTETGGSDPENLLDLPPPSGCASGSRAARTGRVAASRPNRVDLSVRAPAVEATGLATAFAAFRGRRGRWAVRGRYLRTGSRATKWTTTDECDRTVVDVREGVVEVKDMTTGDEVEVTAGSCYVAAPSSVPLARRRCA